MERCHLFPRGNDGTMKKKKKKKTPKTGNDGTMVSKMPGLIIRAFAPGRKIFFFVKKNFS